MTGETPGPAAKPVTLPFPDRHAAGWLLGDLLARGLAGFGRPAAGGAGPGGAGSRGGSLPAVALALPRGGVPVACEVAGRLDIPVDVLVTRKIGYPPQPELGVGAIAEGGEPVWDPVLLRKLGLRPADLAGVAERERAEMARRVSVYRDGRPPPDVTGRLAILVDDGLATGVTARAALRALRGAGAVRTILAVPVAPQAAVTGMRSEADYVVALATPTDFRSVGEWYVSFGQLTDEDVLTELALVRSRAGRPLSAGCAASRPGTIGPGPAGRRQAQAALARRIRRRRSAARSSSLRPPQTPYFSGRASA